MNGTFVKKTIFASVLIIVILLLLFLGASLHYYVMTTVKTADWVSEIDGKTYIHTANASIEQSNTPPFAEHLEPYQKTYLCNCVIESQNPMPGGYTGGFAYGHDIVRYWNIPAEENKPFVFRTVNQKLVRQTVVNQFDKTTLDWYISIDGCTSEDGRLYYFHLGHIGGNFAGCEVDHYVEFNPSTKILTLHVREKLYRGKHKRYRFDFELQNAENTSPISRGEGEMQSVFVPISAN